MKDSSLTNREQIEKWLASHQSVIVFVNSAVDLVKAPKSQLIKPSFSLAISHFYDRPLILNDKGAEAELLFDNSFFKCFLPWDGIWAAYPEGLPSLIIFWNDNSPGKGWDSALLDYLKVEPLTQAVHEKPKLSLVAEPLAAGALVSVDESVDSEKNKSNKKAADKAHKQSAEAINKKNKSIKKPAVKLKLVK